MEVIGPRTRSPGSTSRASCPPNEEWVPSAFNYTRATTIYGGSNEIQKNIIAKLILGLRLERATEPTMNFDLTEEQKPPRRHRRLVRQEAVARHAPPRAARGPARLDSQDVLEADGRARAGSASRCPSRVGGSAAPSSTPRSILEKLGADAGARAAPRLARRRGAPILARRQRRAAEALARAPRRRRRSLRARLGRGAEPLRRRSTWRRRAEKTSAAATASTGEKRFVLNGHAADAIVVSARTSGGARGRRGRLALRGRRGDARASRSARSRRWTATTPR